MSRLRRIAIVCALPILIAMTARASSAQGIFPQIVAPTTTVLAVTASGNPVTSVSAGTVVTLTATVTAFGGAAVSPGTVKFCDATAASCTDIHLLGSAQLNGSGTATLKFRPGVGSHSYKAIFVGTGGDASSASAASSLVVTSGAPSAGASTTTVVATGVPGNYTLTATIQAGGTVAPAGMISFQDTSNANYVLGTGTLSASVTNGTAFSNSQSYLLSTSTSAQPGSSYIASADFNGDGIPDLVVGYGNAGGYTILLGNGDGTFKGSQTLLPPATNAGSVVTGDFNGDGKPDFALSLEGGGVQIFLGNGDGTFTPGQTLSTLFPQAAFGGLVVADFNGDGILDLAASVNTKVVILFGNGDGTFTQFATQATTNSADEIIAADFNNDGKADLATVSFTGESVSVLLGNGDGTFTAAPTISTGSSTLGIAAADVNGDGKCDLVVSNQSSAPLLVLLGNGDGTFTALPGNGATDAHTQTIAVGDVNGDGIADIILPDSNSNVVDVLLGKGDGTFTPDTSNPAFPYFNANSVVVGDFNGDGRSDIAIGASSDLKTPTTNQDQVRVYIGQNGAAATATVTGVAPVGNSTHYANANFTGDTNYSGSVSSTVPLTALQMPTTASLSANPSNAAAGQPVTLIATVSPITAQNHNAGGTVTFYYGTILIGTAPLSGTMATTSYAGLPAGADNVTCTYSGDTNFATSNCAALKVNVSGLPQTITFLQPTSPAYAGTSVLLTATASSGLPVTYTVVSGPANVSGSVLTYTGAGVVTVEADQAGNASYSAAPSVQKTVMASVLNVLVGTTQAVQTLVTLSVAGTLGAINVLTQGAPNLDFAFASGGSCAIGTLYAAGQTCTVNFTFTPTRPGLRFGGITLTNAAAVTLANTYVYGVGTGPQVIYTPGTQSTIGSGFAYASGVAVDGNGNAYVSDLGSATETGGLYEVPAGGGPQRSIGNFNGLGTGPDDVAVDGSGNVFVIYGVGRGSLAEVYAVNGVIPANPTINVISTGFASLNGMKVDGNGNVFLASSDSGGGNSMIQEVLAVNGSIPANPTVLTLISGIGGPTGVAIDQSGNVYFSDEIGNNAYEIYAVNGVIPANPTVTSLASNLNQPSNIVLDAANDVFVTESDAVIELVAVNGVVTPNTAQQVNIGTGLSFPQGMDVDASGNIYIADSGLSSAVKLDFSDAPSLTFANTPVGSTSSDSPQTVRFANGGNADLTFLPPTTGTNPSITTGYTFISTCPVLAAGTTVAYAIAAGASCGESISFTPVAAGPDPGALTLTDNNLNVANAQQNIKLNATGTPAPTTLTLVPSANPVFALQPLTFTVHLTTNGQGDAGQTVTLTYTVGTLVVTASLTTDATGSASYAVIGGLNPGSYPVSAAFAGTTNYQASAAAITEVVNAIPTTSTLTVFPVQPVVNTNIVLTAVVTAQLSGPAIGNVTFFNGSTVLGTMGLSSAGVAQFTIPSLPTGNYSFTCTYNGATDYATSTCPTIAETVVPIPDFSLTATPPSITIETQHHGTMQLMLTGIGLFSGPVYLACQGPLPPYLSCGLPSSETLAVGQTLNFNFTMDTDAVLDFLAATRPAEKTPWMSAPGRMVLAMLLPLALAGFARRRKTLRRLLLLAVLIVGATGLTACGDKWPGHTPPGTYTIPVVGTGYYNGMTITHTLNITLTVTP